MRETNTQWHPAFVGAVGLEFRKERAGLVFEKEHSLNTKPLQIDLLVIRKEEESCSLSNEIGKIFRKYNIMEYKSPEQHLDVDVFYKAEAYACLYKAYGKTVDERKAAEITVSIVRETKPEGLFRYFRENSVPVENPYPGIYYVLGETVFPTQIIVGKELDRKQHSWLRSLSGSMEEEDMRLMLEDVRNLGDKFDRELADSVLEVCLRENRELIERLMGDDSMSDVLMEIMGPKINEMMESRMIEIRRQAKDEGMEQGLEQGLERGIHYLVDALRDYGHSDEEIKAAIIKKYQLSEEQAVSYL